MIIELIITENSDGLKKHDLKINDLYELSIIPLSDCPEDAIIGRDLIDGTDIIKYIRMGFDAAKRGEKIEVFYTD